MSDPTDPGDERPPPPWARHPRPQPMQQVPYPLPAYVPPPPAPPPPRSNATLFIAIAVALALCGGVLAFVALRGGKSGPPHPKEWDPRVLDIVQFAEANRGLKFKQPVFVDFLDEQAFTDRIRSKATELSDEERKELEVASAMLRALGLANTDVDLLQAATQITAVRALAFYDPETERVIIRGTELTPAVRVVVAHELVHVLQDQHFNIKRARREAMTEQEQSSFRALFEGDAERIEAEYADSLSEADRAAYEQAYGSKVDDAETQLADLPQALDAIQSAPYSLGPPFAELLMKNGGQSVLDEALRKPPKSDEQLIDPRSFFRHEDPLNIEEPTLPDGVSEDDTFFSGDFGAVSLFVVLAERIDPFDALRAVDGWGGDSYAVYNQSGKTCVHIDFQGDTPNDDSEMEAALNQWKDAMPGGAANVSRQNGVLQLVTCDPGTDSGLVLNDRAHAAIATLAVRLQYMLAAVDRLGVSLDKGFTFGDCFVHAVGFEALTAPSSPELEQQIQTAVGFCRGTI